MFTVLCRLEIPLHTCIQTYTHTIACYNGNLAVAKWLFEHGVDVNTANDSDCTPFYVTCLNGHEAIFDWMVEKVFVENPHKRKLRSSSSQTADFLATVYQRTNTNKCTPFYAVGDYLYAYIL